MKIRFQLLTLVYLCLCLFSGLLYQVIILYFCLCIHEIGHVFMIKLLKKKITLLEISPLGGIFTIDGCQNDHNYKELLIYLGGPCFSLLLYGVFKWLDVNEVLIASAHYVLIMNLLPIIPLDGGKILMTIKQYVLPYKLVLKLINILSIIMGVIIIIICIKTTSLIIILMSFICINLKNYGNIKIEYYTFLWHKYLHSNKNLPHKIVIKPSLNKQKIYNSFYKGYYHLFYVSNYFYDEEEILKRLLISK